MKKVFFASLAVAALAACTSCNQDVIDAQKATIDSLQTVVGNRDSVMSMLATTMADVNQNINLIKEQEGIVSLNAGNEKTKDQLKNDLDAIHQRLIENKQKVDELQKKLKSISGQNKEFKKVIEVLQAQIESQNAEIANLQKTLESKNMEIGFLNDAVIKLSSNVDSLATVNAETQKNLDATTDALNKAYYFIANRKKLKELGLYTGGLIKGKGESNHRMFTEVDIRTVTTIDLPEARKYKLMTNHPESSYTIDKNAKKLTIKNKDNFWKSSKELIICAWGADDED